jgi:hypothetical protein
MIIGGAIPATPLYCLKKFHCQPDSSTIGLIKFDGKWSQELSRTLCIRTWLDRRPLKGVLAERMNYSLGGHITVTHLSSIKGEHMQHKKSFFILLIVVLLFTASGSALAQGSTPPSDPSAPKSLPKSVFGEAIPSGGEAGPALVPPPLVNGDFEQGPTVGWTEESLNDWELILPTNYLLVTPHSGSWAVWLGGDDNEVSTITQTVTLPGPSSLRLYYWLASEEVTCGGSERAYVHIFDIVGNVGKDVYTWQLCESNDTSGWVAQDINLSEFGSKTVRITIGASTNAVLNSNFFVDDVSLYETFADVSYDYWAEEFIQRLYEAGITGGCGGTPQNYCPNTAVTRDQMAVFLLKGMHGPGFTPPAVGASTGFSDVPVSYWAAAWIKELAAQQITGGCAIGQYCPTSPVTRDQMAVFLLKAKYGFNYTPPAVGSSTGFNDVPVNHWAAAWIKQLAAESITGGCGTGLYCPGNPVNRAEMAVFLVRTFSLP